LLGHWHDVMRTTYAWGSDTWASQKWNFVKGEDGTVLALFNAWWKSRGVCTEILYTVERKRDHPEFPVTLTLEGNGDKFTLWLENTPASYLVVSMCFDHEAVSPSDCQKDKYQMSVLSREPVSAVTEDVLKAVSEITSEVENLDSSVGDKTCPTLFIGQELVTADFAKSIQDGTSDSKILHIVGVAGSRVKLPCTVGDDSETKEISWKKESGDELLTSGRKRITTDPRYRVRHSLSQPKEWELRIRSVAVEHTGVYLCIGRRNETVARVVLSVAVPARITSKSDDVGVAIGASTELTCEASGRPAPTISWFFVADDTPDTRMFKAVGGKLLLENFTQEAEGRYICQASNGFPPRAEQVVFVRALPDVTIEDTETLAAYATSVELTCKIETKMLVNALWKKDGRDIVSNQRHVVELSTEAEGVFMLTLLIRELSKDDFGEYVCIAKNKAGATAVKTTVKEKWPTGDRCSVENIPVMPNFSIQRFLGGWERMQTTTYFWGNKTYQSEVLGHFITISGSLLQYYRGYDPLTERCLEPGAGSMVLLDTPGDYLVPLGNERGRYKVVFTDYTHAVVYFCLTGDAQNTCPRHLLHVQIISRLPVIPDDTLRVLYRYVQRTCVPVSDLVDTVPGLCQMPPEFMYQRGYIGRYPEPNCQVANLQVQRKLTQAMVSGTWRLVGMVKPKFAHYNPRTSAHIVSKGKDLAIFYRSFDSVHGLCSSPEAALLHMAATPGSYYHDYSGLTKSITVDSKFLYASDDSLVLYTCLAVRLDGSCYNGSELVEVFHRTVAITDLQLLWLRRPMVQACVDIARMEYPVVDDCPVPASVLTAVDAGLLKNDHTQIGCHQSYINTADDFSEEQFMGTWLTVYRTGYDMKGLGKCSQGTDYMDREPESCSMTGVLSEYSKTTEVVRSKDGRLLLLSRYYNSTVWKDCPPTEVLQLSQEGKSGNYNFSYTSHKGSLKVLHMDNTTALVYWCHSFDGNGVCHKDSLVVEILARSANAVIPEDKMHHLNQLIVNVCVDVADVQPTSQSFKCTIPDSVSALAQMGEITAEFDVPVVTCKGELLRGMPDANVEELVGEWNVLWRTKMFWGEVAPDAESSYFVLTYTGLLYLWRSFDNDLERCKPEEAGRYVRTAGPGDYYSGFDGWPVVMKILYTDNVNMLALWCHLDDKAECHPDRTTVEILSKNLTIKNSTMEELLSRFDDSCLASKDWMASVPGTCQIENDVLTAAYIDGIGLEYSLIGCRKDLIQGQRGVTDDMVIGKWTSILQSQFSENNNPAARVTFHFVKMSDGQISVLYRLYNADKEECLPAILMSLERENSERASFAVGQERVTKILYADNDIVAALICPDFLKDNTCDPKTQIFVVMVRDGSDRELDKTLLGEMHIVGADACVTADSLVEPSIAVLKVVWLDDENAVLYWCFKELENGLCRNRNLHLSVLSRQPDEEVDAMPFRLLPIIADCCVSKTDLINVNAVNTPFSVIQCAEEFIPVMEDFDVELFSGEWQTVRQTKFMWGNATWESLLRSFVTSSDGSMLMAFTGQQKDMRSCVPTEVQTLQPSEIPGQWSYTVGDSTVTLKVVWTDYVSSALVYTCSRIGEDGLCQRAGLQVEYLSRGPHLQEGVEATLTGFIPQLCVDEQDVESIQTGLCKITEVVQQAAKVGTDRVSSGGEKSISCRVQDIPLATNFKFLQMTGYWYEIARTRFTFNTMESTISYYEFNPEKNYLDGLFIGTLQRQCQSALKSVTKKKFPDGPDSIITGRIQGPESIFPWITFNIIYFDGSFMVHFACYAENADGTCPRDKTEVTLLGRSRELTTAMEAKLDSLMTTVCLSREDLVTTQETDDCLPMLLATRSGETDLPDTEGCALNDIPVVENLKEKEEELLGTWYGLGTVDYGAQGDPTGFVVSVRRSTSQTLLWKQWNIKSGSCQAEKAVFLKPACSSDATGDYVSTRGSSFMLQWSTLKILRFEDGLLLVYWCTKETHEGACKPDGVRVDILRRFKTAALQAMIPLLGSLPSVCLAPENMHPVQSTDICDRLVSASSPEAELASCSVDLLPSVNPDLDKMSGIWYDVSHTVDPMFPLQKAVIYYHSQADHQMSMFLVAFGPDGQCKGPMEGRMKPRCHSNPDANFMGRLKFPGMWSWAPWRVLHAEYNTSAIVLSCMDEQRDGSCSPHGSKILVLTRDSNPRRALRQKLNHLLRSFRCFNHLPMENVIHKGASCEEKLNTVIAPGA
ncbi:hypothetical protein BaRGS_00039014, partial [Batillaria attramentaria]